MNQHTSISQTNSPDHAYADTGKEILQSLEEANHFTEWLFDEIKPYIKGLILEIGSGLGTYSKKLIRDFPESRLVLSEIDQDYCQALQTQFRTVAVEIKSLDLEKPIHNAQIDERFETIISLNVMEHIEDDVAAFNHVYDALAPGGAYVVLVPAHNFLFNSLDRSVGHFCRYNKQVMAEKIAQTPFILETSFYFNFLSTLGWFVNGHIFKKTTLNETALGLFDSLVPLIRFFEGLLLRKKLGISLIAILRKPFNSEGNAEMTSQE